MLAGLPAVLIPVIIHLLGRRRVKVIPFATLRFLRKANEKASARWRLRRILLLLSRMLILGSLAVLFAGPGCLNKDGHSSSPATWVIILDNSPSMSAERDGSRVFERAKDEITRMLNDTGPMDRFLFVTTSTADKDRWNGGFATGAGAVMEPLHRAAIDYSLHDVTATLQRAFGLLEKGGNNRVVLATDLQKFPWRTPVRAEVSGARLFILDAGFNNPVNTWINDVVEEGDRLRVMIGRQGGQSSRVTVSLLEKDKPAINVFSEGDSALFRMPGPDKAFSGSIELTPGGDLGIDDRTGFVPKAGRNINLLLVNGDARGFEIRDELLFIRRALAPGSDLSERVVATEIRPADLDRGVPADMDAAILANVAAISEGAMSELLEKARAGMGLILTAGDGWDRFLGYNAGENRNSPLKNLFVAPLRDVVTLESGDSLRPPHERIDIASLKGPMSVFGDTDRGDLSTAHIRKYWLLNAEAEKNLKVWARLENGVPLLLERPLEKGRLMLLATTIDRDGADLCLQPAFIPFLERLILHAAGRLKPGLPQRVTAGRPMDFEFRDEAVISAPKLKIDVRVPDGTSDYIPPLPGNYEVHQANELTGRFVAVMDPAESDLSRIDKQELDRLLGPETYELSRPGLNPVSGALTGRTDVSSDVAGLLLALLIAEALLSVRWRRRRKFSFEDGPGG